MEQYSPKNQAFLLAQMPTATDVRPFKAWKAAGRSVIKGEKALRVWIPKARNEKADPESLTEDQQRARFVRGPVFDISQTKECAPRHQKAAQSARTEYRHEQAWTDYAAAIDAGDIPDTLDFADWYELREEMIRSRITKQADAEGRATEDATDRWLSSVIERRDGNAGNSTIATASGAIIAQVEHHDLYPPVGGGSQELDETTTYTAATTLVIGGRTISADTYTLAADATADAIRQHFAADGYRIDPAGILTKNEGISMPGMRCYRHDAENYRITTITINA